MEISFISISFSLFTLLISFSALFGIYKIGINYLNGIAMLIIYFSLMVFVYRAKYISALIQTVLYIAFMIAGEYIAWLAEKYGCAGYSAEERRNIIELWI